MGLFKKRAMAGNSGNSIDDAKGGGIWSILKGAIFAILISLVLILIFAFVVKFTDLNETVIRIVNQVIKVLSVFIGVFIGVRKSRKFGFFKGILIGLIYSILAFLIFSIMDGKFEFGVNILNDLLFSGITGAITGVIAINLKK